MIHEATPRKQSAKKTKDCLSPWASRERFLTGEEVEVDEDRVSLSVLQIQFRVDVTDEEKLARRRGSDHLQHVEDQDGHGDRQNHFDITDLQGDDANEQRDEQDQMKANDETPGHVTDEKARVMNRFRRNGVRIEIPRRGHIFVDALIQLQFVFLVILHADEQLKAKERHGDQRTENDLESPGEGSFEF